MRKPRPKIKPEYLTPPDPPRHRVIEEVGYGKILLGIVLGLFAAAIFILSAQ